MSESALEKLTKARRELEEVEKEFGKEAILQAVKEHFAENPEIKSVMWIAYRPGFNDGSPCLFRFHEACDSKDLNDMFEDTDGGHEDYGYPKKLAKVLSEHSDTLERVFDDNQKVIIRNDENLTTIVEYYDCGY